ncbi:hypothetical protein GZL_08538 [Streptomyces sp. 769]|nr:hypothetical protein GZL_08538 [Streptomyces sp. 769]
MGASTERFPTGGMSGVGNPRRPSCRQLRAQTVLCFPDSRILADPGKCR